MSSTVGVCACDMLYITVHVLVFEYWNSKATTHTHTEHMHVAGLSETSTLPANRQTTYQSEGCSKEHHDNEPSCVIGKVALL